MLKTLLLYCSILSVFASDAQYTPTPIACQPGVQCGNVVAAGNAMPTASDFQSVNRYVTPSDYSAAAGNPFGTYTPATVQNFYSVVSEETPPTESPFAPSVRKSPGVPKRAPVGDGRWRFAPPSIRFISSAAVMPNHIDHKAAGDE